MLIRWANETERTAHGFGAAAYGEHDVLIAVDRRTRRCLGIAGIRRNTKSVEPVRIFDRERRRAVEERLSRCADRRLRPQGGSFHYRFPSYAAECHPDACPCCAGAPMPDGHVDVAESAHSWLIASPAAQGRLFGKCCVVSKRHNTLFYDLPKDATADFICDVQRAARALHAVTEAVRINFEIHGNSAPHLHCHLFPRYLDDDFPSAPIDYRETEPSPYESEEEFQWFVGRMREELR